MVALKTLISAWVELVTGHAGSALSIGIVYDHACGTVDGARDAHRTRQRIVSWTRGAYRINAVGADPRAVRPCQLQEALEKHQQFQQHILNIYQ